MHIQQNSVDMLGKEKLLGINWMGFAEKQTGFSSFMTIIGMGVKGVFQTQKSKRKWSFTKIKAREALQETRCINVLCKEGKHYSTRALDWSSVGSMKT